MGSSNWSSSAFSSISSSNKTKTQSQIFNTNGTKKTMSAKGLDIRESRDSDNHPESLAIMVYLDVTGSMGDVPEMMVKDKLGTLMDTIINNGVKDPQIMFGAIGDHHTDSSPLQVGQFESGHNELNKWLTSCYLEGHGGGNNHESYPLAWLIGGRHTSIDCFEKRSQKGFIFTVGDEGPWDKYSKEYLKDELGYSSEVDLTAKQMLEEAERMYNVYHIHFNDTWYKNDQNVFNEWKSLLGERFIVLDDYTAVCETIATIVAVQNGVDKDSVISSLDTNVQNVVSNALAKIDGSIGSGLSKTDNGIIEL